MPKGNARLPLNVRLLPELLDGLNAITALPGNLHSRNTHIELAIASYIKALAPARPRWRRRREGGMVYGTESQEKESGGGAQVAHVPP